MKKLFTFFLALTASVGMMNAKVTWNSSNISDLYVSGTYADYSKEGVTLSANADQISASWYDFGDESMDGISFNVHTTGGFTFSNTLGKNFTKIEMTLTGPAGWDFANLGSGWSFYWDYTENPATVTWTGNASTVDLMKEASDFNGERVKSIVFYFEGDSEEPDPTYTVALKDGTVNADKVTLSATSAVEGATVTVTPDEEYEITAFKATYNTTEELSTSFNAETGAYSFTMPAYAVTIEATIALKPVPEGDIFAGFTATAGSGGFDNEGHANLVDNKFTDGNWSKWCTNNDHKSVPTGELESCWWIDFEASAALNPTGYILTTGNDTGSEHGRNPKNWVLKAKLNADDAWTTIATVTNDATMKNQSFKDYKFFVDQSGSYKYFRFEVFANQGANVMQLCELRLIGSEAPDPDPEPEQGDGPKVQLAEFIVPTEWTIFDEDPFTVDLLTGFVEIPEEVALTLSAPATGKVAVGYAFTGEGEFKYVYFVDGELEGSYARSFTCGAIDYMSDYTKFYYPISYTPAPEPETPEEVLLTTVTVSDGVVNYTVADVVDIDQSAAALGEDGWTSGTVVVSAKAGYTITKIQYNLSSGMFGVGGTDDEAPFEIMIGSGKTLIKIEVYGYESGSSEPETPTAIESHQQSTVSVQKLLRDGQLLIIRDGKTYNVVGTVVR